MKNQNLSIELYNIFKTIKFIEVEIEENKFISYKFKEI